VDIIVKEDFEENTKRDLIGAESPEKNRQFWKRLIVLLGRE